MLKNLGATSSGGSSGVGKNVEAEIDKAVGAAEKAAERMQKAMQKAMEGGSAGGAPLVREYLALVKQLGEAEVKMSKALPGTAMHEYWSNIIGQTTLAIARIEQYNKALHDSHVAEQARQANMSKSNMADAMASDATKAEQLRQYTNAIRDYGNAMAQLEKTPKGSQMEAYWKAELEQASATIAKLDEANAKLRETKEAADAWAAATKNADMARAAAMDKTSSDAEKQRIADIQKYISLVNEAATAQANALKAPANSEAKAFWDSQAEAARRAQAAFALSHKEAAKSVEALKAESDARQKIAEVKASVNDKAKTAADGAAQKEQTETLRQYLNIIKQVETAQANAMKAKEGSNVQKVWQDAAAAAMKAKAEFEAANRAFMATDAAINANNAFSARTQQANTLAKAAGYDAMSSAEAEKQNAALREYISLVSQAKSALAAMKTSEPGSEMAKHWESIARNAMAGIHEIMRANPAVAALAKDSDALAKAAEKYERAMAAASDKATKKAADAAVADEKAKLEEYVRLIKEVENAKIKSTKASGPEEKAYWDEMAAKAEQARLAFEAANPAIKESEAGTKAMADSAERVANAEKEAAARAKDHANNVTNTINPMRTLYNWIVRMALYRGLRTMWREATSYAKEYYNTLNEIQVVTMKNDVEMESVSADIKRMSKDLGISQTTLASSATLFYRQGLSQSEVNDRLEWTTKYSRVSGAEMEDAANQITAVVNSMDSLEGNVQRVVDVFVYLGDHAASSGEEIATAMQKAAATADSAGMEFEFLATSIAVVSEKTRMSAETIGTAFNTMMARLHSIKKTGYNEEDETKINDVAKALASVGIELMNSEGEWNRLDDIFTEISKKWETMTDKQRSYIATTMAGVRAQNYFNALMGDMSKGNDSRFMELYTGSKEAEGIVDEKYTIWLDSATAAQERMKVSLQELYSVFVNGDVMKGFFNSISDIVTAFTNASKGASGVAIKLTAVVGVIVTLIVTLQRAAAAYKGFSALWSAHPYAVIAAAIIGVIAAIVSFCNATEQEQQSIQDLTESITSNLGDVKQVLNSMDEGFQKVRASKKEIEGLRDEYIELSTKTDRTKEENERLQEILKQIAQMCPEIADKIGIVTSAYSYQYEVVKALNDELRRKTDEEMQALEQKWNSEGYNKAIEAAEDVKKLRKESVLTTAQQMAVQDLEELKTNGQTPKEQAAVAAIRTAVSILNDVPTARLLGSDIYDPASPYYGATEAMQIKDAVRNDASWRAWASKYGIDLSKVDNPQYLYWWSRRQAGGETIDLSSYGRGAKAINEVLAGAGYSPENLQFDHTGLNPSNGKTIWYHTGDLEGNVKKVMTAAYNSSGTYDAWKEKA